MSLSIPWTTTSSGVGFSPDCLLRLQQHRRGVGAVDGEIELVPSNRRIAREDARVEALHGGAVAGHPGAVGPIRARPLDSGAVRVRVADGGDRARPRDARALRWASSRRPPQTAATDTATRQVKPTLIAIRTRGADIFPSWFDFRFRSWCEPLPTRYRTATVRAVLEFRILGPLEVVGPDGPIQLGGPKHGRRSRSCS